MFPKLRLTLVCIVSLFTFFVGSTSAETFHNPYRIPTNVDPASFSIGDFNGDGRPDLVWVEYVASQSTLHIVLAQANGGYLPAGTIKLPTVTTRPTVCVISDFNNDGHQDLACTVANQFDNSIALYSGNGDGTFQPALLTTVPPVSGSSWVIPILSLAGDLNGDGNADLLEGQYNTGGMQVLLGDGKGHFNVAAHPTQSGENQPIPVVADVNGDGHPDLLFPVGPQVALGNGDGSFQTQQTFRPVLSTYAGEIACAFQDVDGDGHLDAVCANDFSIPEILVLHGNPDGSFDTTPVATQNFNTPTITGTYLFPLAMFDANRDGVPDIFAYAYDGFSIALGGAKQTYAYPAHYAVGYLPFDDVSSYLLFSLVDMDGDGIKDAVAVGPRGIYISYGNPDGSLRTAPAPEIDPAAQGITLADFNGDGIPDIVDTGKTSVSFLAGKGDGTFGKPVPISPNNSAYSLSYIAHGDFNGDGKQDFVVIGQGNNNQGPVAFFFAGRGDGSFALPVSIAEASSLMATNFFQLNDNAAIDVDKDGKTDILDMSVSSSNVQLVAHISNGDGSFKTVTTLVQSDTQAANNYPNVTAPAVADFNEDGRPDAVYGSISHGFVELGNGDGTFKDSGVTLILPSLNGSLPAAALAAGAGDFDGDGHSDIAILVQYGTSGTWFSTYDTALWVYYGDGHGAFSNAVLAGSFDRKYSALSVADFNKDGLADVVLGYHSDYGSLIDQANGDSIAVLHGQAGRTFSAETNYTASGFNAQPFVADLNHDGMLDLLFLNGAVYEGTVANSVTVLLNEGNGPAVTGTVIASPEPSYVTQAFNLTATLQTPASPSKVDGTVDFRIDGTFVGSGTLSGNAATVSAPSTLAAGQHALTAYWPGDANYKAVTLTGTHNIAKIPLTVHLNGAPASVNVGGLVTFNTTFNAAAPSGTNVVGYSYSGTLTFSEGQIVLGQQQPSTAGFNFSTASLPPGKHIITASYSGDDVFVSASSNAVTIIVQGLDTVSMLSLNPAAPAAGEGITLTAGVVPANPPGPANVTGSVTFTLDGATLGTAPLSSSDIAQFAIGGAAPGPHNFGCTYSGDATYNPSSCSSVPVTVPPATSTLVLSSDKNPAYAMTAITFKASLLSNGRAVPGVALVFVANGQTTTVLSDSAGTAILVTPGLLPGTYPIAASFGGTTAVATASAAITETVTLIPTATTLGVNPTSLSPSTALTLTASVAPMVAAPVSGTVTFYDGTNALGYVSTFSAAGQAMLAVNPLKVGQHTITCAYSGSNILAASQCLPYTVSVPEEDFTLSASVAQMTLQTGHHGTVTLSVTPVGSFSGEVSLACGQPLPDYVTCELSIPAMSVGAGAVATTNLTIDTDAVLNFYSSTSHALRVWSRSRQLEFALVCPCALLILRRRRRFAGLLCLFVCLGLSACSSKYPASTPPGTYPVSVVATGHTSSGAELRHQLIFLLKVTP